MRILIPVLVFVLTLAVGAFGGARIRSALSPREAVHVDSATAQTSTDSLRHDSTAAARATPGDSVHVPGAGTPAPASDTASHDAARAATSPADASVSPVPRDRVTAQRAPAQDTAARARWSGALAKMPPVNAAKLLVTMTDDEIADVLSAVADRQLALILAALPAERAAAVMRHAVNPSARGAAKAP